MKKFLIIWLCCCLLAITCQAQQLTNARFQVQGNEIEVRYDLLNVPQGQTFEVSLLYSTDGGKTWQTPRSTSGDIGSQQSGGSNKRIVWKVQKDLPEGLHNSLGFKVKAASTAGGGKRGGKKKSFEPEMVFVKGGTFEMGSTDGEDDEKHVHSVTLDDFYIGKYEVTQAQWRAVMGSDPPELNNKNCDQCPVESVSWNDVQEFLKKLNEQTGKNYMLPTEAEWEYAARGGNKSKGYKYAGSNNIGKVAWHSGNCKQNKHGDKGTTHPVGKKRANKLGLYDMSGNVWEWCSDWYGSDYYKSPANNPQGPDTRYTRVVRGGSLLLNSKECRVSNRSDYYPVNRLSDYGFRVSRRL